MAEKKGVGHAYNVDFLNVVFAASSLFLFLSVIWMVWDDYDRDWKNTQRRFAQLEYQVTQAQLAAGGARGRQEQARRSCRRSRRRRRRTSPPTRQKVDELQAQLERRRQPAVPRARSDYQYDKATYDQDRYDFEASRAAGASSAEQEGRGGRPSRRSALTELNLAGREDRRPSEAGVQKQLGAVHRRRSTTIAEADRRAERRADAAAASGSTSSRRAW